MSMEAVAHNPRAPSEWTDARVERIKLLHSDGYSASQIAADIGGVTRNAVIGKLHRLGLRQVDRNVIRTFTRDYRNVSREEKARRQSERRLARIIVGPSIAPQQLPEPPPRRADFLNITFDNLARGDCRYPTTAEPPFLYCGNPAIEGQPYCLHCHEITHAPKLVRRAA